MRVFVGWFLVMLGAMLLGGNVTRDIGTAIWAGLMLGAGLSLVSGGSYDEGQRDRAPGGTQDR